jgi:hypothetical protein
MIYALYSKPKDHLKKTLLYHLYKNKCSQIEKSNSSQSSFGTQVLQAEADVIKAELDKY